MTHFDGTGGINVYLELYERQITRINNVEENWVVMYLLSVPLEIVNRIVREPEHLANN